MLFMNVTYGKGLDDAATSPLSGSTIRQCFYWILHAEHTVPQVCGHKCGGREGIHSACWPQSHAADPPNKYEWALLSGFSSRCCLLCCGLSAMCLTFQLQLRPRVGKLHAYAREIHNDPHPCAVLPAWLRLSTCESDEIALLWLLCDMTEGRSFLCI